MSARGNEKECWLSGRKLRRRSARSAVNFLLRTPLWPIAFVDSKSLGGVAAKQIPVLDHHELAGGKLAALCARNASRDVFDARELLRQKEVQLDDAKLRLAFVIYGSV